MSQEIPSPVKTKSRVKKWFRLILLGGLGFVVLVCAVAWMARLKIANSLLAKVLPNLPAKVGSVEWNNGGIELTDLEIRGWAGDTVILSVPRAHLTMGSNATAGNLGVLKLQNPIISVDQDFMQSLRTESESVPSEVAQTTETEGPVQDTISFAGVEIENAQILVVDAAGNKISAQVNWSGGSLAMKSDGSLRAERQHVTIKNLSANINGTATPVIKTSMGLEVSSDDVDRRLVIHQFHTGPLSAAVGAPVWKFIDSLMRESSPEDPTDPPMFSQLRLGDVEIGPLDFSLTEIPWLPRFPTSKGKLLVKIQDVETGLNALPAKGKVSAELSEFELMESSGRALVALPNVRVEGGFADGSARLKRAKIAPFNVAVSKAQAHDWGLPEFEFQGVVCMQAGGMVWLDGKWHSEESVEFNLAQVRAKLGDSRHDVLVWDSFNVQGRVEEILDQKRLRKLTLSKPVVRLDASDLAVLSSFGGPSAAVEPAPSAPAVTPTWEGWVCDDPEILEGEFYADQLGSGVPSMSGNLGLKSQDHDWHLGLSNLVVATPDIPLAPPMFRGSELLVVIDPAMLWQERRIKRVHLRGSRLQIGATAADAQVPQNAVEVAERNIVAVDPQAEDSPMPKDWHIAELEIEDTKIFLHHLVPDTSDVLVPLAHKIFRNLPLTEEGLKESTRKERIELPFVYVPGTRAGTSVADLDTNFVHFSLAGLMRKEIDAVELVNPKIYVGDSLFHYVEKIRTPDPEVPAVPQTVTEMRSMISSLVTVLMGETPPPTTQPGWSIDRVKAINGKLITTVKDSPLFRVPPLPFGADSSVKQSQINAELAVPPGIYKPVLGMELVVCVSQGAIAFNLPTKATSNNLVQVFKADWVRFKQFRIADVTLSVTYDKNGAYAKFWAKGYQGDLEGAFNLYLDDNLSWDMWLTGTNIETKDITDKLSPASFSMKGRIDFKIIAQGDKTSLYQATGNFKNRDTGKIKVVAVDDLIKSLPGDWNEAERKWVIKIMEVLRDFSYTKCEGDLRFYGMEGDINLKLRGPDGERNFEVKAHDRRMKPTP